MSGHLKIKKLNRCYNTLMRSSYFIFLFFVSICSSGQNITTYAGNGSYGNSGNGGPATLAQLAFPLGLASDNGGNLYIADHDNNVIRKVNSSGTISVFAGTGTLGYSGDGGLATSANLCHPAVIAFDNAGNMYFTDQNGVVIRKISTSGIITSVTGNLPSGYSGDGGPLIGAQFRSISGLYFDNADNMYITDFGNNVVRKVNTSGIINTIAGNGTPGFSGDGGPATAASLDAPYGVVIRSNGDIYIPDARNNRIRVINNAGIISTYAGTGTGGYTGDGGPSNMATLHWPWHSTIDASGNIYIADAFNAVVRKIDNSGIITTYAGNGTSGYSGDGGLAIAAQMIDICGVNADPFGNIYIVNRTFPNVVRKVNNCPAASIAQQPLNTTLCNSGNATFSVTTTNTTGYQWQVNTGSVWTNLSDNSVYSGSLSNTLNVSGATISMNNFQYRCILSNGCGSIFSTAATLFVTSPVNPSIVITAPSSNICSGTAVLFSASVQNGGTSPTYQWKKNGVNVGTNSNTYIDNSLVNGDIINCVLSSNATCITGNIASSNSLNMTVTVPATPSVVISASANNICFGTPITFTTSINNGGASPVFSWFKNGVKLPLNSPTFTDNSLNNGDTISCSITSSLSCATSSIATSSPIVISVNQLVSPSIVITSSANSVCRNTLVSFTASSLNEGNAPIYQWKKNGTPVGSNINTFSDNSLNNGDVITCILTSNANCVATSQVTSNPISISVYPDPVVILDKTNTLCEGSSRILDGGNFSSYLWNNGSTNRTITINNMGLYSVNVTDINGCTGSGFTNITTILPSPKAFLPNDTSICTYGNLFLKPNSAFQSYLWNNGSTNHFINIVQPGQYWLQVKDNNGCTGIDSTIILPKDCLKGFFMPTAFTPNNDGKNDIIKPILLGKVRQYLFKIYNRWGQLIFQTTDLSNGWNGTFKGLNQDGNVFIWMCTYQFENELTQNKKGTFILIR